MALMPNPVQQQQQQAAVFLLKSSLYEADLAPTVTQWQLYDFFSQLAPAISVSVGRAQITRNPHGYASVNYNHTHEGMALAFDEFRRPFIRIQEQD